MRWHPSTIKDLGLQATAAAIWERNERGEITIRQAHDECDAAIDAVYAKRRAKEQRAYRDAVRRAEKAKATRKRNKEWREGVAKIMAEVRRREAAAKPRFRVPAIYERANPLDGTRLWDNS